MYLPKLACGVAMAAFAAAAPGLAQEAATDAVPAAVEDGDIIVTAQKRAQSLQDVGITISAFSGEDLSVAGVSDAVGLATITPALSLAGSYSGQSLTFAIRGVTQQDFSGHAEAPTAIYADDAYLAYNNAAGVGLFDIERVEVLKGPQGTLFGRNATGGLVHVISRKPTRDANGYVTLGYGSYDEARIEAAVGGPISDNLMFRIAGMGEQNDWYVKNISPTGENLGANERFAFRGHLLAEAGEDVEILLTGYTSRSKFSWAPYYSSSTREVFNGGGQVIDSIIVDQPTLIGTVPTVGGSRKINANNARDSGGINRLTGGTAKITWDAGIEITSVTDYKEARTRLSFDGEASEVSFLDDTTDTEVRNFSQEFRLFKDLGSLRWYAGAYYLHIESEIQDDVTIAPLGAYLRQAYGMETDSYSGFTQVEFDISPTVTAIGGVRVAREKKDYFYTSTLFATATPDGGQGPLIGPARPSFFGKSSDTLVTAKAQLEFRPNDDLLIYAGWNRGSKSGSFNAPYAGSFAYPNDEMPYDPEKLDAYEIGTKLDLMDRKLRLNGAVFYYDYTDYQSFKFIGLSNQVTNNKAEIYGGEIEITATPAEGLTIELAGSHVIGKVYDVSIGGLIFPTNRPPFTSKWQGTAAVTYEFPFAGGALSVRGDVSYRSSFFYSVTNFSSTYVDGYALVGANVAWTSGDRLWRVSGRVTNLADERYSTVGFDLSSLCGCSQVGWGEPRWFSATITRNF